MVIHPTYCSMVGMIRLFKELLRWILGKATVNYEELLRVLCDCKVVINSRPLLYITNESNDLMPLTPATFIPGSTTSETPYLDTIDRCFSIKWSRYMQKIWDDLRQRFKSKYLSLRIYQGCRKNDKLWIRDIMLIRQQLMGWLATEIYPGKDRISRVAKLETFIGESIRPFQRLYPLEISSRIDAKVLERTYNITELPAVANAFTLGIFKPSHLETKCSYSRRNRDSSNND